MKIHSPKRCSGREISSTKCPSWVSIKLRLKEVILYDSYIFKINDEKKVKDYLKTLKIPESCWSRLTIKFRNISLERLNDCIDQLKRTKVRPMIHEPRKSDLSLNF